MDVRFGDPFVVGKDKLNKCHKVASHDGLSLRKFADYLSQCETAMITISSVNALNDDREIQKIQNKLPDWMGNRWSRIVWDYKQKMRGIQLRVDHVYDQLIRVLRRVGLGENRRFGHREYCSTSSAAFSKLSTLFSRSTI